MIFVKKMIKISMPDGIDKSKAVNQFDFVQGALFRAPIHVKIGITGLTLAYLPFHFIGLGKIMQKAFPFFSLLVRVYRSLTFLKLFETK